MRKSFSFILFMAFAATQVHADGWAVKLFPNRSHDFGNVPRGADVQYAFKIKNPYDTPVRISSLKRTCGCTDVLIDGKPILSESTTEARVQRVLQPLEETSILLTLDTRKFVREKSSEITVFFDRPNADSVRLTVRSFIRQDVVFNPGAVMFGTMSREKMKPKSVDIEYAGKVDWTILGLENASPNLDISYQETYRRRGQVGYRLVVAVKEGVKSGSLRHVVTLLTNDPVSPRVPVLVEGQVVSSLVVTPATLSLGTVQPNQPVSRRVLLRSDKPFKIVSVEGTGDDFEARYADKAQKFHTLTLNFKGTDVESVLEKRFKIRTDLLEEPVAEVKATVRVVQ